MRFVWVRHGPTHAKTMVGWTDLPADLSDHQKLARLDDYLPSNASIISSDLIRAKATTDALLSRRTLLEPTPAIREIHFGDWENLSFAEVENTDPDRIRAYWEQPGDIAPPGGESWNIFRNRVNAWVDEIAQNPPSDTVIAVAHMGVILSQLQRALGITAYEVFAHKIDNLSVTELVWANSTWGAKVINHTP